MNRRKDSYNVAGDSTEFQLVVVTFTKLLNREMHNFYFVPKDQTVLNKGGRGMVKMVNY